MNKRAKVHLVAVMAWLTSGAAVSSTVNVVPSDATPRPGDSITLTVSGVDFSPTSGATLGLTWNSGVVDVAGVTLAPGSPFFTWKATPPSPPLPYLISVLAPAFVWASGDFNAFVIGFTVIGYGPANITLVDDGMDLVWVDPATFGGLPVTYHQADVTAVPLPAVGWLLVPAFAALSPLASRRTRTRISDYRRA